MNKNFENAAKLVGTLNKKGEGLWASLCLFVHEVRGTSDDGKPAHMEEDKAKAEFKAAEKEASASMKVQMGENSTYRVSKGVLIKAVKHGLSVVDDEGKAVGKTALEKLIKDLEEKAAATPLDVLRKALKRASDTLVEVDQADLGEAFLAIKELYNECVAILPASMKA